MLYVCSGAIRQSHGLQAHCFHTLHVVICVVTVDHYESALHYAQNTILLQILYHSSHLQLLLPLLGKGWPAAGPHPQFETPCPGCPGSPGLRAWSACTNQPATIKYLMLKPRSNQGHWFLGVCSVLCFVILQKSLTTHMSQHLFYYYLLYIMQTQIGGGGIISL